MHTAESRLLSVPAIERGRLAEEVSLSGATFLECLTHGKLKLVQEVPKTTNFATRQLGEQATNGTLGKAIMPAHKNPKRRE